MITFLETMTTERKHIKQYKSIKTKQPLAAQRQESESECDLKVEKSSDVKVYCAFFQLYYTAQWNSWNTITLFALIAHSRQWDVLLYHLQHHTSVSSSEQHCQEQCCFPQDGLSLG